jgi:hypothetical protein
MKIAAKIALALGFVWVSLFLLSGIAAAADAGKELKDLVVEESSKIHSKNSDFKIKLRPIGKRGEFAVGDKVGFEFKVNRDAYVTILDVGTSGKVHVIFPNKWNKSGKVVADRTYRIPGEESDFVFKVKGPPGVNYIKAIATTKESDWFGREALGEDESPFYEVKDPAKKIKDIGVDLEKQGEKGWTETETNLTIVSRPSDEGDQDEEDQREDMSMKDRDRDRPEIKLWTGRKTYQVGEPVTFYFYAEKDGYLNLVDFGTSDKVHVLFPNRMQRDNFIKGGEVVKIPVKSEDEFRFRVKGPEGVEVVKAVFSTKKLQLYKGTYDFDKYVYQPWEEKGEKVSKDIDVELHDAPRNSFSRAKTTFRVER